MPKNYEIWQTNYKKLPYTTKFPNLENLTNYKKVFKIAIYLKLLNLIENFENYLKISHKVSKVFANFQWNFEICKNFKSDTHFLKFPKITKFDVEFLKITILDAKLLKI